MNSVQKEALNRFFVQTFNHILNWEEASLSSGKCSGLTMKELHTIEAVAALEADGKNTMSQIAKRLFVSVGALTTAVNVLVNKDCLERRSTPKDRRIVQVFLTPKGWQAENTHRKFHQEMVENIGSSLSEVNLDTLIQSLKLLSEFFENKTTKKKEKRV